MEHYTGLDSEREPPRHGGQWVDDGKFPSEAYNFAAFKGVVYGYAQPVNDRSVNLERIGGEVADGKLTGVRVVFFAHGPKGQVIVGWYESATVLRDRLRGPKGQRNGSSYFIVCPVDRAVLLPLEERTYEIPRGKGNTGQSNWTYPLREDRRPKEALWMQDAIEYTKQVAR